VSESVHSTEEDRGPWRPFVRYWLPGLVCLAGILAMILGPDESKTEGGAAILGAGLSIYLINFLFRIGASSDRERSEEQEARDFFEAHGFWPDEQPPTAPEPADPPPPTGAPDTPSDR
jgi:hypothetical protein